MRVVALISGGKDSCYNMMQCVAEGHEIVALANLKPSNADEIDSYMYQTVGHHAIDLYSQAMELPLYRRTIQGEAIEKGKNYVCNDKDEVEDLFELLKNIKSKLEFDGVSVGAVLSNYQRVRVENVCSRLGLLCLAFLWRRNQKELLQEMINCHVEAIIIKVAALGLDPQKHLGNNLSEMYPHLCDINKKFDCHICGEGGEYETFTLDCPLFQKKIVIDSTEVIIHSDDAFAPVGYLNLNEMHLEDKAHEESPMDKILKDIPLYKGDMTIPSKEEIESFIKKTDADDSVFSNMIFNHEEEEDTANLENEMCRVMVKQSDQFAWISGIKAHHSLQSVEDETDLAMKKLENSLKEIGSNLQHVILVHIYVNNMKYYAAINSVYKIYFDLNPPARVCVQTNFLDSTMFQLDCLVIIPAQSDVISRVKHDVMHVQSISHWAPANIGPYSQVVKVNDNTCFVAGCIGLWPSSMSIINGGVYHETPLALRHVLCILDAFLPGSTLSHVISGVCYVTKHEYVAIATAVWLNFCKMYHSTTDDHCMAGDERRGSNMMVYVVVDGLPKEALVEWHVVSHYCSLPLKYGLSVKYFKNIKVSLTSCVCPQHMCASVNANTEIQPHLSCKLDISEMVKYFVEILESFITSCSLTGSMLLILRIFYRKDIFKNTHLLLQKAFSDAMSSHKIYPVTVFVPVSGLSSPTQVFSVSGWLQMKYTELES